jgi:hypothetical protein
MLLNAIEGNNPPHKGSCIAIDLHLEEQQQ